MEKEMSLLDDAIELAFDFYEDKEDKAGCFYYCHISRIASKMNGISSKIVAYLHDIVEDGGCSLKDIRERFGDEIADAVDSITRRDDESYAAYIDRVATNPIATKVKIADLIDNSNLDTLPEVTEEDVRRQLKYSKALLKLCRINSHLKHVQ